MNILALESRVRDIVGRWQIFRDGESAMAAVALIGALDMANKLVAVEATKLVLRLLTKKDASKLFKQGLEYAHNGDVDKMVSIVDELAVWRDEVLRWR